jgi:TonB family protein
MSGLTGEVVVEFSLDIEGRVRNPFVVRSNNPGFDEAALDAIRKWQFEPAAREGQPVNTRRIQQNFSFQFNDGSGQAPLTVERSAAARRNSLPPELQYDVAPRLVNFIPAVYPFGALVEQRRGKVEVAFIVGENGRVVESRVLGSEGDDFAAMTLAMLDTMEFMPAFKAGKPMATGLRFEVNYNEFNGDVAISRSARSILQDIRKERRFPTAALLDKPLVPVSQRPPIFPSQSAETSGEALIEFYIDDTGMAQLPRVVRATAPEFGHAACLAVVTWRFAPPQRDGRATTVRAQVPVLFVRK